MRLVVHLRKRYALMASAMGMILLLAGAVLLTPLIGLVVDPKEASQTLAFVAPAMLTCLLGLVLRRLRPPLEEEALTVTEGGIVVTLSWLLVVLVSAWPFMQVLGLSFSQAVFESMSGWTTTGLSVVDVSHAGSLILLWRSITQFAGGAGLAIIMMSALVGPTGVGIASAEGRADQLVPQVKQSARLVLIIYGGYAVAGILAYWLAGMTLFDAVNHSFAAISTGGFSTKAASIGFWDSPLVEAVTLVLMILGNLSFVTAWFLWQGKLATVTRNGEVRLMALVIPLAASGLFAFTTLSLYPMAGKALRVALFEAVTALTTTGFSTVGYGDWNSFGILLMILLMLIGGGTCSTAGAIKQFRVYLLWRLLKWEIQRNLLPRTAVQERPLWEGERLVFVNDAKVRQAAVFVFLYLATFLLGSLVLCASGFKLGDSLFEFASSLGTVGLSVGLTTAGTPLGAMWAETLAMFLGRLEFLVIFATAIKIGRDLPKLLGSGATTPSLPHPANSP